MASTIATTVTSIVTKTVTTSSATASSSDRAPAQAGVLEGGNPTTYSSSNPIILFIIQAGIIIVFCRLLHWPLSKLRQPRVIAEVIGGILLGPSVMMRIPGFEDAIFPKNPSAAMSDLNTVANLGLILFLFLVALEVDMRLFLQNWRVALSVGLAGMILPFGLGCAVSWGLYNTFRDDEGIVPISFPVYMLFIGTALSITAFPVLCRILTELNLLGTPVGVTTLAAGVGNDVTGWILLALCVVLVNNGSGLTALWVLFVCVGYILFLVFAIRPAFLWMLRRTNSIQNGPTQSMVALTLLLALTSAWFTGIIGVHPIFGAFLAGLICPHEGLFTIKLTEKIEDLVTVLFLPLYFAYSGLSTNLGLLDSGITWAYVVAIIAIAFSAKIIGGTLAARLNRLVWRESLTIGCLMSCKGLVELIVLNIGLQAKILSQRTFTMFVVMALVTTVSTTPLVSWLYPPWYQKKLEAWKRGEIDWDGNKLHQDNLEAVEKVQQDKIRKLVIYLRLDSLPSLFTFISLLGGDNVATKLHPETESESKETPEPRERPLEVYGVRILELTERTSSVMKVSEKEEMTYRDPVVNAFRTFAQLNNVAVSGDVSIVPASAYAETIIDKATQVSSDFLLIPWSESGSIGEEESLPLSSRSPLHERLTHGSQSSFVRQALASTPCNAAIFVNRGFGGPALSEARPNVLVRSVSGLSLRSHADKAIAPVADRSHHVFLPYFGSTDDRVALRFVLQLAQKENITATITHFILNSHDEITATTEATDTGITSVASTAANHVNFLNLLQDSLPTALARRVTFNEVSSASMATVVERAHKELGKAARNAGDLLVVGRNSELNFGEVSNSEIAKTLGVVADTAIAKNVKASVVVIRAGGAGAAA